jgi:hypothetical protein
LWLYFHPEEIDSKSLPKPEPSKVIAHLKWHLAELSNRLSYLRRRHMMDALLTAERKEVQWEGARLFKKLHALRESQEDTEVHEALWNRLENLTSVAELRQLEKDIAELETHLHMPSLEKARKDYKRLNAEANWLECQVNLRKKRQAEAAAAATESDAAPKWAAQRSELEARITVLKQQNESLKEHLGEIQRIEVPQTEEPPTEPQQPEEAYNPYTASIETVAWSFLNWLNAERLAETARLLGSSSMDIDLFAGTILPEAFADDRMKQCVQAHQEWLRGYMQNCKCPTELVRSVRVGFAFIQPPKNSTEKRVVIQWQTELVLNDNQVFQKRGQASATLKPKKTGKSSYATR